MNLQLLRRSARYLEREGIDLPVVPVFAASLLEYGPQSSWAEGIDRYLAIADTMNLRYVALSWSASDPGKEGYAKLAHLLTATQHAATGRSVIGWRQGAIRALAGRLWRGRLRNRRRTDRALPLPRLHCHATSTDVPAQ